MNIVFVCSEYPYDNRPTGGFGTYIDNISQALIKIGNQVTIICLGEKDEIITKSLLKIYVIKPVLYDLWRLFNKSRITLLVRLGNFLRYPLGFSLRTAYILNKIIKEQSVDIIEGGDFGAELFFYLLFRNKTKPKTVIKLHTPSFVIREINNEKNILFFRLMKFLEIYCLNKADAIYSPTQSLINKINDDIKLSNIKRDKNLIIYVGKLQTKKGIFTLVKAIPEIISRMPLVKFILIGPDTYENNLSVKSKLISVLNKKQLKSHVTIIESTYKQKLYTYYQQALITIIPSLWENFPNVLIEASLYGSLVIGTDVGGIKEIYKDFPDLLITPNDYKALSLKVTDVISTYRHYELIAEKAKGSIIYNYNYDKIGAATISFYVNILRMKTKL
jgi:glycogen synthase